MEGAIRVMHVDDESALLDLAAELLEREQEALSVTTETDPRTAIDLLGRGAFECVVSDYQMPGMDGLEFLQAVRADHPDLPFVLFTGKGSEEIAAEAISEGVTDYLQKKPGAERYTLLAQRIVEAVGKRRTERELDRTNRRFAKVIEHAADLIAVIDATARFGYVSRSAERVLGYTPEELLGRDAFSFVHPDDLASSRETFVGLLSTDAEFVSDEHRLRHADGTWRWVETRARDLRDDPDVEGIVVYARDVTERKTREAELRQYEAIVETIDDVAYTVDADLVVTFVNRAVLGYAGVPREAIVGTPIRELSEEMLDDDAVVERFLGALRRVLDGESDRERLTLAITVPDRRVRAELHLTPLWSADAATPDGVVVVSREVPDQPRE